MRILEPGTLFCCRRVIIALGALVFVCAIALVALSCSLPEREDTASSGGTTPVQTTAQSSGSQGSESQTGSGSLPNMTGGATMPTGAPGADTGMGGGSTLSSATASTSGPGGPGGSSSDSTSTGSSDADPSADDSTTVAPSTTVPIVGYESLGGALASGPGVSSWGADRVDVFVSGPGNALWHTWYSGGWGKWENLGGIVQPWSDPAAASWGDGRIDVFVHGVDNVLWHKWYGGGWYDWEDLGGPIDSSPAVCSWGSGRLDVFARGTNGHLMYKKYTGSWSEWADLGGTLKAGSSPAAVSWSANRIDVFIRGEDDALWHKWYAPKKAISFEAPAGGDAQLIDTKTLQTLPVRLEPLPTVTITARPLALGTWSDWESLGGILSSSPGVSSWAGNRLDVFVRGPGNTLWHRWYDGGWGGWEDLAGSPFATDPDAVSWGGNRIDIFVGGTDGALWHRWWSASGWGP